MEVRYIIRGGPVGRERLRILSRVMRPTTLDLLRRVGVGPGMAFLELGAGGGDVAFDVARMVGPQGAVVGIDMDAPQLEIAREEARGQGLANVEFRRADILQDPIAGAFDVAHARFLLTHLADPALMLAKIASALRPGGLVVIEDVDFRGYFAWPPSPALGRYTELYRRTAERRGHDAFIGPRLPSLLEGAGFAEVSMNVVQPAGTSGEVKLISPLTMENIADAVLAEGLATREEIDALVAELYDYARTPGTVGCMPRVVEAWGRKPL